jgi:hypothetical protein
MLCPARLALALLVTMATALAASGAASAEVRDLGPVANDSALSAYGGWVVWSERQPDGRWHLVGWHGGARVEPAVASRDAPFDADVGSDAHGRPVATYSRCIADPVAPAAYAPVPGFASPNGLPRQSLARGCGVRVLDLTSGRERALSVDRPVGAADTTPSMWRGDVAFARMSRGAMVAQVLIWRHRGGRLARLSHGTVPTCPYGAGCTGAVRRGEVQQLDLGASGVAFVWDVAAPGVIGAGDGWELRVDDLRTGTSRGYDRGYQSGACGARYPVSPTMVGSDVWFDELRWLCDVPHTSYVHGVADGHRGLLEAGPPLMWQVAVDGRTAYSIRGPRPAAPSQDPPCIGSAGPCRLVAEPLPDLPATGRPVGGPFF